MTVVLEDQIKTIAAEISDQFFIVGDGNDHVLSCFGDIEDVVRVVIAQYDISSIDRLQAPNDEPWITLPDGRSYTLAEIELMRPAPRTDAP